MNRAPFLLAVSALACFAAADTEAEKKAPQKSDMSQMPSDVHAPLLRPKAPQAGRLTERVTSQLPKPAVANTPVPHRNFIDDEIFGKMERDGVPHAPLATDQEFIRRIKLDLAGHIPSPTEVREFLADSSLDKRARTVERLVGSPEFVDKWSYFFMDILRANGKMGRGHTLFHYMLKESLAADRPYDDWVRDIIASSAKSNYVVASSNPIVREHVEGKPGEAANGDDLSKVNQLDTHDELAILYGKIFLGINTSCISCHDGAGHLERVNAYLSTRKRSDFFQESAFLARTRYIPHVESSAAIMGHFLVDDGGSGYDTKADSMLRTKRSGGPNTPKFLLTDEKPQPGAEPREELARMLTANPQFARAAVNMFWAKLMGVGIVDPYDEFDLARLDPKHLPEGWDAQPSNPELLEKLAVYFRENNYSVHKLFKLICNSSAYQLSARFPGEWQERYTKYYARKFARMLSAEELHDSIVVATERPGKFVISSKHEDGSSDGGASASVSMAMQVSLPQPRGELKSFMAAFGESNRGAPPHAPSPSPLQPIMMMRSSVVNDRVLAQKDSRVQRLLDTYKDNGKVVDELFMATISREPMPAEKALVLAAMEKNRVDGAQNLQWALLNIAEFLYNFSEKDMKTIGDLMPSRRELLKFGGLGLLGASAHGVWPIQLRANPAVKATPRGSARNVIFFELAGALSHVDSFDFKENVSTQKDFDVRKTSTGLYVPHALFPRMTKVMDKVAHVRSFISHEEVHLRGQYYVQAGRQLNVAFAPEIPSIGSVVAYELEARRRESDNFPTYVSFNLSTNQIGALSTGYLPPRFSVFDLNPEEALKGMTLDQKATELLEQRWQMLSGLREIERDRMAELGRTTSGFEDFSITAKKLLTDPRWPATFQISEDERKRYGNTSVGLSSVLARNLLKQDGGTRYIHICHNGWDHHKSIWDRKAKSNHYVLINEMDPALASLLEDLGSTPSPTSQGKTLLDETLVVCMGEFGRTPGELNFMGGRDHHKHCFPAMFAGAGVKGGTILGASDSQGWKCVDTGWERKQQPRIENVVATIYSALGIDWSKEVHNTPSGRTYTYVDPLGANGFIPTDELSGIYG